MESFTQSKLEDELEEVSLPADLVEEVLSESDQCINFVDEMIEDSEEFREEVRSDLSDRINTLDTGSNYNNVAGVDGSFDIVRSAGVNMAVCSAVSVSQDFKYAQEVFASPPSQDIQIVTQGLMSMLELKVVTDNNAGLTILDGSFISTLVNLNQMVSRHARRGSESVWSSAESIIQRLFLDNSFFSEVLNNETVIASPKNATSSEFLEDGGEEYKNYAKSFNDGAFFTRILNPGEYITYVSKESEANRQTNLGTEESRFDPPDSENIVDFFQNKGFRVVYFKPYTWSKAYKLEIPNRLDLEGKTEKILNSFKKQVIDPSIIEPYPQWLADSMSKKITEVTEALKGKVQSKLQDQGHNVNTINSILRGYRTSGGF